MQDEPDDNHEGEKDIECNRNRKVWKTEVIDGSTPDAVERGSLQQDTHHYIDGVSSRRRDQVVGAKIHTQIAKVQEAGEGDGPNIPGIDNVATIELEEPASGHLGK